MEEQSTIFTALELVGACLALAAIVGGFFYFMFGRHRDSEGRRIGVLGRFWRWIKLIFEFG